MQDESKVSEIPLVVIEEPAENSTTVMGVIDKDEDGQEYQDFVMAFLDRLCENCKKMREQIVLRAKCAGILPEDEDGEHSVPDYLAAFIPETQMKIIEKLRRRTVSYRKKEVIFRSFVGCIFFRFPFNFYCFFFLLYLKETFTCFQLNHWNYYFVFQVFFDQLIEPFIIFPGSTSRVILALRF